MRNVERRMTDPAGSWRSRRPSTTGRLVARLLCILLVPGSILLLGGCEGVSHENIDRWPSTQKGPGKLRDALQDSQLEPDLSAHAGRNLIQMDETAFVIEAFGKMSETRRQAVLDKLVRRLWRDARIEGELTMPSPDQVAAKDALFALRKLATGEVQSTIDENLVDWLTGGYYAARARQGAARGSLIVRTIGAKAAPKLLAVGKFILVSPADTAGRLAKIEDPLLIGLAATGDPDAVDFLLDLMNVERNDDTLSQRVIDALHLAYVSNENLFDVADGKALIPHVGRLASLAQDETRDPRLVNDAIRIIGAVGAPACIKPLVELIAFPHENENFLWVAANSALQCGKSQAIVPVADAIPQGGSYTRKELAGALWVPMAVLDDKQNVAKQARILLESQSWVSRIIAVELLGELALASSAASDAEQIARLGDDKTPLRGWWGDQDQLPKNQRKPLPRLGERSREVASKLAKLAQGSGK